MIRTTILLSTIVGIYGISLWITLKCIDIGFDYYNKKNQEPVA
jgi:hypothetical protein